MCAIVTFVVAVVRMSSLFRQVGALHTLWHLVVGVVWCGLAWPVIIAGLILMDGQPGGVPKYLQRKLDEKEKRR
tara:strand:+ start:352 stop:573 length:222 start_codon:yes stop_codon:yes gene_type:complete